MLEELAAEFEASCSRKQGAQAVLPPVGMNVFVINSLAKDVPMSRTFLGVAPFFGAELLRVALLVAFPALTLWLPHVLAR